ncbi:MAG: hypothetical protein WDN00_15905 [Limisphaerales bacterium]
MGIIEALGCANNIGIGGKRNGMVRETEPVNRINAASIQHPIIAITAFIVSNSVKWIISYQAIGEERSGLCL